MMKSRFGPETQAVLSILNQMLVQQSKVVQSNIAIQNALVGGTRIAAQAQVAQSYGMHVDRNTIDKSSTFTQTEINVDGFNFVQIATDGTLSDISYFVRNLQGTISPAIKAQLSPQFAGYNQSILVSNATAESGKTVFVYKWLAPWAVISALWSGNSQPGGGGATSAQFTPILKGQIFNTSVATATDFFVTDIVPTNNPTLLRVWTSYLTSFKLIAQIKQGATTRVSSYNGGTALTAAAGFGPADILMETTSGATKLNWRHDSGGAVTLDYFVCVEVPAET